MGKCETENLTDSAYGRIVVSMNKESSPELQKIYDKIDKQKEQTKNPKTSWLSLLFFWRR
jgi:hypothetical protein